MTVKPSPWTRYRLGIQLGLAGLLLGVIDLGFFMASGFDITVSGYDGTFIFGLYLSLTFGILGAFAGLLFDQRRRELEHTQTREANLLLLNNMQQKINQTEKLAALGQIAAGVAHEVRNPLAIIRCQVQNLAEDIAEGIQPKDTDFNDVITEIDRLSRAVEAMLGFARPLQPRARRLNAAGLWQQIHQLARAAVADSHTALNCDPLNEPAPTLELDPDLTCQIVLGLVGNAVSAQADTLHLSYHENSTTWSVSVADNGPGVPVEAREKIFEPFYTTRNDGHGLGLAIARQMARAQGGRLEVGDADLGGALFTLTLPRTKETSGG